MGNSLSASLLLAARSGNANGVKQLVEQGADVHTTFEDEKTALHVAAEEGMQQPLIYNIQLQIQHKQISIHKSNIYIQKLNSYC